MAKHSLIFVVLTLGVAGAACAPDGGTIWISSFNQMDQSCNIVTNMPRQIVGGLLDVAPGEAQFWVTPEVSALINPTGNVGDIVVGGTTVQNKGLERPVVDSFVFNYVTVPKLGKFSEFTEKVYGVIDTSTGAAVKTQIGPINLISHQAAGVLDAIPAENAVGATTLLTVRVQARGHTLQSGASLQSQVAEFPITIVRSDIPITTCGQLRQSHSVTGSPGFECIYPGQSTKVDPVNDCCDSAVPGTSGCP